MTSSAEKLATIAIRPLVPADAGAYHGFVLRGLTEFPASFGVSYDEVRAQEIADVAAKLRGLEACGELVLGAFDGALGLVGIVVLRRMALAKMRHRGSIGRMYVAASMQGAGLGRRLLEAAIASARATPGIEQLSLVVDAQNTVAQRLYSSLGFVPFGLEPREIKVDGIYHDSVHMWLRLG